MKKEVDRRRSPGRFLLSGSANLALLDKVSDSLAGRALYLTLHPFSRRERTGLTSEPPFLVRFLQDPSLPRAGRGAEPISEDEILDGGLPPVALGSLSRELWFLGYEQTYLERDLRDLSQVADLVSFRNLLRLVALRTGQLLNQSELARDARLPVTTVTRYLGLLETSFLVSRLPPFLRSRAARLIKTPKILMTDSGIAAHLADVDNLSPTSGEPLRGALLETYVGQNLLAILGSHLPRATVSFWSVQGRYEVNFVVTSGKASIGIEVKAATRFGDRDLAGLKAFLEQASGARAGILAYNGTEAVALGTNLFAIPIGLLLS